MSYISRLLAPARPLVLFSNAAFANDYKISVNVDRFPGSPTEIITSDSYCMHSDGLKDHSLSKGEAVWEVNTKTELFSYCGVRHSSATFHMTYTNAAGKQETAVVFEFYKPLSESPYLIQNSTAANIKCIYDDLRVHCEAATEISTESPVKTGRALNESDDSTSDDEQRPDDEL